MPNNDNTHSAIVMNSPRLSTSDRATEFPVASVWFEEKSGWALDDSEE